MKIKLIALGILFFSFSACQEKEGSTLKNANLSNSPIMPILIKQIKDGNDDVYGSFSHYGKEDLDALVTVEDTLLKNNGYKLPTEEVFSSKIKAIFGRTIDYDIETAYLKIETDAEEKCNKELVYYPNTVDAQYIYVIKKQRFISNFFPLPEILDYLKFDPSLAQYEKDENVVHDEVEENDVTISQWKDNPDNLSKKRKQNTASLLARNKYLFNESRDDFKWLVLNDENFLESLYKTFGYSDDEELLKWIAKRAKFDQNNLDEFGKLFWTKQCDGTIKNQLAIYKALHSVYNPDKNRQPHLLDNIQNYIDYFADFKNKIDGLSAPERTKIVSHIVYFAEQYKYDSNYKSQNKMMGRLRYWLGNDLKAISQNNFYNLPKFKEWWEKAEYDMIYVQECEYEGTCGRDNPPPSPAGYKQ